MSDLSDRIAAVLETSCRLADVPAPLGWSVETAVAVIRDLGLRVEWGALDHEMGGVLADTREELTSRPLHHSEKIYHRYITEWTCDE